MALRIGDVLDYCLIRPIALFITDNLVMISMGKDDRNDISNMKVTRSKRILGNYMQCSYA